MSAGERQPTAAAALEALATPAGSTEEIVNLCREVLNSDGVIFWARRQNILSTRSSALSSAAAERGGPRLLVDLKVGEGAAGKCAAARSNLIIHDLQDTNELNRLGISGVAHRQVVRERNWHAAVYVPVLVENRLLGVLAAYSSTPSSFDIYQAGILAIFAERVAARMRIGDLNARHDRMVRLGTDFLTRSHDIRENSINLQATIATLRRTTLARIENPPEAVAGGFDKAKNTAHEIQILTEKTLRNVTGHQAQPRYFPLGPVMRQVGKQRADEANWRRVDLRTTCEPNLAVYGWEDDLRRCLLNLVDNALFFVSTDQKRGRRNINVIARVLRDTRNKAGRTARICVSDDGPGISDDERHKIFDFGYTGKGSRGLGLGLPFVESVIEASGGWIEVESKLGKGAEFNIFLPSKFNEARRGVAS